MKKEISAVQLKELLDKNNVLLIDIRGPHEYKTQHIDNAIRLSPSEIDYNKIFSDNKTVVLYCQFGGESRMIAEQLVRKNPSAEVYVLDHGIEGWIQAGLLTKKGAHMPVIQQFYLGAGLIILTGLLLALFVNPWFYIIPAFIGFSLIFAGMSGFCGLQHALHKMPWNR